nr:hypothetical protein [Valsa mali var. pyri (nom. inval.)]
MDHIVSFFSKCVFFIKKFLYYKDFVLAGHIIQSGKHTTELGIKLLNLLNEGMNTGRDYLEENVNNFYRQSLIKEVLAIEAVYFSNKDGLRINSNSLVRRRPPQAGYAEHPLPATLGGDVLISNQLFFILASSLDGDSVIFDNSEECSKYFGVSKQTINVWLSNPKLCKEGDKGEPINCEGKVYRLRLNSLSSIN